jgi:hypothetical protein
MKDIETRPISRYRGEVADNGNSAVFSLDAQAGPSY